VADYNVGCYGIWRGLVHLPSQGIRPSSVYRTETVEFVARTRSRCQSWHRHLSCDRYLTACGFPPPRLFVLVDISTRPGFLVGSEGAAVHKTR